MSNKELCISTYLPLGMRDSVSEGVCDDPVGKVAPIGNLNWRVKVQNPRFWKGDITFVR